MITIKCAVRIEGDHEIIFTNTPTGNSNIECWTQRDGHNLAGRDYMQALPLANQRLSELAIAEYQAYLNSLPIEKVKLQLVKRIIK